MDLLKKKFRKIKKVDEKNSRVVEYRTNSKTKKKECRYQGDRFWVGVQK